MIFCFCLITISMSLMILITIGWNTMTVRNLGTRAQGQKDRNCPCGCPSLVAFATISHKWESMLIFRKVQWFGPIVFLDFSPLSKECICFLYPHIESLYQHIDFVHQSGCTVWSVRNYSWILVLNLSRWDFDEFPSLWRKWNS